MRVTGIRKVLLVLVTKLRKKRKRDTSPACSDDNDEEQSEFAACRSKRSKLNHDKKQQHTETNGDYIPDAVSSAAYGYETDDGIADTNSSSSATKKVVFPKFKQLEAEKKCFKCKAIIKMVLTPQGVFCYVKSAMGKRGHERSRYLRLDHKQPVGVGHNIPF